MGLVGAVWPFVASGLVMWGGLKYCPQFVAKVLTETFEQRNRVALEKLKSDLARENALQAELLKNKLEISTTTMQNSLDFLTAGQVGLRTEFIETAKFLWGSLIKLHEFAGGIITLDMLLTNAELNNLVKTRQNDAAMAYILRYESHQAMASQLHEDYRRSAEARLFAGDRLWQAYFVVRGAYSRICLLAQTSLEKKQYMDWRDDSLFLGMVASLVPQVEIDAAKVNRASGVRSLFDRLEFLFIREAMHVMSGSKAVADDLSNLHVAMSTASQESLARRAEFKRS